MILLNMRTTYKDIVNHKSRCFLKSTSYKSMLTPLIYVACVEGCEGFEDFRIGRLSFGSHSLHSQALVLPQRSAIRK